MILKYLLVNENIIEMLIQIQIKAKTQLVYVVRLN